MARPRKIIDVSSCPCCQKGCCPAEDMPDVLNLAVTGNGDCGCYTANHTIPKFGFMAGRLWTYSAAYDYTAGCGGLDRSVDLWCQSETVVNPLGWTLHEGKTYAIWAHCHATDDNNPANPARSRPVEVTVLSCKPYHAIVTIPVADYTPFDFNCHCDGSVTLEFTE